MSNKLMINKGFSLIELMIVITIIGILAAVAVPSYQKYIYRTEFLKVYLAGKDILKGYLDDKIEGGNWPGWTPHVELAQFPQVVGGGFISWREHEGQVYIALEASDACTGGCQICIVASRNSSNIYEHHCYFDNRYGTQPDYSYFPPECANWVNGQTYAAN